MPKVDTAEERNNLLIWQQLGRSAARQVWNKTGIIDMRVPKNRRRRMRVAYTDGWNTEMRSIVAAQSERHSLVNMNWEI